MPSSSFPTDPLDGSQQVEVLGVLPQIAAWAPAFRLCRMHVSSECIDKGGALEPLFPHDHVLLFGVGDMLDERFATLLTFRGTESLWRRAAESGVGIRWAVYADVKRGSVALPGLVKSSAGRPA